LLTALRQRARALRSETLALALAARDPRTPWLAKLLVAGIVAYALSPIDLIPDFIPVLGLLDDLLLIPLCLMFAIRLIPPTVLMDCRVRAQRSMTGRQPGGRVAAAVIIGLWLLLTVLVGVWIWRALLA